MKKGAYDYLPKPFTTAEVVLTLRKAEEREKLRREVTRLRQRVKADQRYPEIVAKSAGMRERRSSWRPRWRSIPPRS